MQAKAISKIRTPVEAVIIVICFDRVPYLTSTVKHAQNRLSLFYLFLPLLLSLQCAGLECPVNHAPTHTLTYFVPPPSTTPPMPYPITTSRSNSPPPLIPASPHPPPLL